MAKTAKTPVFAASAIITLAPGIGATTAVLSTMNAVMLRWLPVPNPQQLAYRRVPEGPKDGAVTTGHPNSSNSPEQALGEMVSGNFSPAWV